MLDSAVKYLDKLKAKGEGITPKKWTADKNRLTAHKNVLYEKMKAMREDIKTVEQIRKNAEQLVKADTTKNKTDMER
ncbi:MAG: hypothetical protein RR139_10090 [Lachnospiraceae bacterium]